VEAEKRKRAGGGWSEGEEATFRERVAAAYDTQATPEYASARLW
jgi:3-methylcrotonyl-CoA carboxylase beta subunit